MWRGKQTVNLWFRLCRFDSCYWYFHTMGFTSKERHNEYNRQYKAARRAEWFAGKCCRYCGSTYDLQADHIDPRDKSKHIKVSHNVWSWSVARREAELAKCQVLCERCHRTKSAEELVAQAAARRRHGTTAMYRFCNCAPCREANRLAKNRQRAARIARGGKR
jgi:DNA-directed RNA polymerase subunit M/transcription elongation factor TFIIS